MTSIPLIPAEEALKNQIADLPLPVVKYAYAGKVVYAPGGKLGPRIQADLQLVFLHTGGLYVEVDGVGRELPVGHAMLLTPGHTEQFTFGVAHETRHRWINVNVESVPDELLSILAQLPPHIEISDRMNRIVDVMMSLINAGPSFKEAINDLGRAALMLYVSEARQQGVLSATHPAIRAVKEYIEQHYARDLDLAMLARQADLTPEHLIRVFQKQEGQTPMKYLWNYRLEKGIGMLQNTGLSIGEIADQIGFKTPYHFARLIKQLTGKTASDIRRESWAAAK
jgi:AraC-like DNA-binding protein